MVEKLHIYITIIAALIVNVCCIFTSNPLYVKVLYIILTIVVFFVIGKVIRNFVIKNFYPEPEEENEDGQADENKESDEVTEANATEISEKETV